jgi:hypothetical protein
MQAGFEHIPQSDRVQVDAFDRVKVVLAATLKAYARGGLAAQVATLPARVNSWNLQHDTRKCRARSEEALLTRRAWPRIPSNVGDPAYPSHRHVRPVA